MSLSLKACLFLLLTSRHLNAGFSATKAGFLRIVNLHRMAEPSVCLIPSEPSTHKASETNKDVINEIQPKPSTHLHDVSDHQSLTTDEGLASGTTTCTDENVLEPAVMTCSISGIEEDDSSILGVIHSLPNSQTSSPLASCQSNFSPSKTESEASISTDPKQLEDRCTSPPAKKQRPRRVPPNAFVSIRIPSLEIKQALERVQDGLVRQDHDMKHVLTSLDKLHLTLTVFRLSDDADIERAKTLLDKVTQTLLADYNLSDPVTLSFKGLGAFGREVLFAKVEEGPSKEKLMEIADVVQSEFTSDQFEGIIPRSFKPHVTVAKMSKMPWKIVQRHKRRTGKKKGIDPRCYSEFQDVKFGSEVIEGLELLSMELPSDDQGYYHCFQRNQF